METTQRFGLPLLVFGQGQKDLTHNEAISAIDCLLHGRIVRAGLRRPPIGPTVGDAWLIGEPAEEDWVGLEGQIACWTAAGWRFFQPVAGMALWNAELGRCQRFDGLDWRLDPAPALGVPPQPLVEGGSVVDVQARTALAAVITRLTDLGIFAEN